MAVSFFSRRPRPIPVKSLVTRRERLSLAPLAVTAVGRLPLTSLGAYALAAGGVMASFSWTLFAPPPPPGLIFLLVMPAVLLAGGVGGVWPALAAAACFHAYQQVSYMILARVSPVTHSIGNCVKRVIVIVASVVVFRNPMGPRSLAGTAIALAGVFLYSQVKRSQNKKAAAAKAA